ncbi:MAG: hypothetical protein H6Q16_501 [Bacteroidetes bacterium]|nr:hypothetical protein [Bacteroidota bacterium]
MGMKYFDTIDEEYLRLILKEYPSIEEKEETARILKAKNKKYKDCDLDNLYKELPNNVLYDIYVYMINILEFKDKILMYKLYKQQYEDGIGINKSQDFKQFFRELSIIIDKDDIKKLNDFNLFVDSKLSNNNITPTQNTTAQTQSEIDVVALKNLFKPVYTSDSVDSVFNQLIRDLSTGLPSYNKSDITAIAYVIYESGTLHNNTRPNTFIAFLRIFCSILNITAVPTTKRCKVQNRIERFSSTFYYLNANNANLA